MGIQRYKGKPFPGSITSLRNGLRLSFELKSDIDAKACSASAKSSDGVVCLGVEGVESGLLQYNRTAEAPIMGLSDIASERN